MVNAITEKVVEVAVRRWAVVLVLTVVFCGFAYSRFRDLPIEAFPDVTDPMVEVVGLYPGQAAEEVERRVTLELERVLAGTPKLFNLRSVSVFGLTLITLKFEDKTPDSEIRAAVSQRLADANLPSGATVEMGPQSTPVGQIYRYTVRGPRSLKELRAIQDFVIERRLRGVPGVAEVVTFGGYERNYQVQIDPARLTAAGVSVDHVYDAIAGSNKNAGGGYIGIGSQEFIIRGLGSITDPAMIKDVVIHVEQSVPVRIRDVADVVEGSTPRRGAVGRGKNGEVVEGIVLLRRGTNPSQVLAALHDRVKELNESILPSDVKIATFYDRTWLVDATLATVGRNMIEGVALVLLLVYVFLGSVRAVVIVSVVIPISLLSAFLGLSLMGLPANLISLGAIDFGILVDGAIIVVEATLYLMEHRPREDRALVIREAASAVARPVLFAMLIIIVALGPIFFLERVEGRIFAPMAFTYAFALIGALLSALLVVPACERFLLSHATSVGEPLWLEYARDAYLCLLNWIDRFRYGVISAFVLVFVLIAWFASGIGTEFLPELNEGGFYVTSVFPPSISLAETGRQVSRMRELILESPEVGDVLSHIGRPENATQAEGPNNAEFFVTLKPDRLWRKGMNRRSLESELRGRLATIPGAQHNFSQPITDRVYETISGIIGQVVVKVKGTDLNKMTELAEKLKDRLHKVEGIADLSIYQAGSVPTLKIDLNRDALARRGITIDDVQSTLGIALGGAEATEIWDGERRYPVSVKLPENQRKNLNTLGRLFVGNTDERITLGEISRIEQGQGRASIWREDLTRFVAIKFNVRGRDLGSTVDAAQASLVDLELPEGTYITWGGEFQNQRRAMRRLAVTVPVALLLILGILYGNFGRWIPTLTVLAFLPVAVVSAVAGLRLLGENFSVSSAVGCIALLGQVVLSGVVYCTQIRDSFARGRSRSEALVEGAQNSFRPVLLTTLLAMLGLVPASLSHAMGSETQRPFAIAIVSGLLVSLPVVMCILPVIFARLCRLTPFSKARPSTNCREVDQQIESQAQAVVVGIDR